MRGLAATRSKARDLILRQQVQVDGHLATRPGAATRSDSQIEIAASEPHYVSRGGLKLAAALDHFNFSPTGVTAIDVGASTGGFTDVLLRGGAHHVYTVDVGRDQLDHTLRANPRVTVLEGTDARTLDGNVISDPIAAIVSDVSFISLTQALPAALSLAAPGAWLIALVKPQFELDQRLVGKGGLVKSDSIRQQAIDRVSSWLTDTPGWTARDVITSPITGKSGNVEFLIGAIRDA